MNSVNVIGNLTRDPEIRYTTGQNQMAICNVTVAVNDGYGDKQKTSYVPVTVFGKMAENCEKFLRKGSKVAVSGKLTTGSYEKDGKTIYTWNVTAFSIEFLTPKNNEVTNVVATEDMPPEQTGFGAVQDDDIPF